MKVENQQKDKVMKDEKEKEQQSWGLRRKKRPKTERGKSSRKTRS